LRYFVRSYVTRPTTIRAITEIPAKTPRPMGRTESFFPGTAKFDDDDCSAAAAVPDPEDEADAGAVVEEAEELLSGGDVATELVVEAPVGAAVEATVERP
jgi:hypothetical protein